MQNEIVCMASAWQAIATAPNVGQVDPEHENLMYAGWLPALLAGR
jgi:hypothetical protein